MVFRELSARKYNFEMVKPLRSRSVNKRKSAAHTGLLAARISPPSRRASSRLMKMQTGLPFFPAGRAIGLLKRLDD